MWESIFASQITQNKQAIDALLTGQCSLRKIPPRRPIIPEFAEVLRSAERAYLADNFSLNVLDLAVLI